MDFLKSLIIVSEKAANIARLCRQNEHLFQLLVQQKSTDEANPRFVTDFKTLADVLIQEMVKWEIGNQFPELREFIKGEENNTFCNKLGEAILVEVKETVDATAALLQIVLNDDGEAARLLACAVHRTMEISEIDTKIPEADFSVNLTSLGIWIDPIDSTAEYINGTAEKLANNETTKISLVGLNCVTVLIGVYNRQNHLPIIGIVNQPFRISSDLIKWHGKCFWGVATPLYTACSIAPTAPTTHQTICISSSERDELKQALSVNGFKLLEVSGAGYKMLTVAEGLADAYVLSKSSTFKWDTCGPQALLRALGGDVVRYEDQASVTYGEGETNCNKAGIVAYRKECILQDVFKCGSKSWD